MRCWAAPPTASRLGWPGCYQGPAALQQERLAGPPAPVRPIPGPLLLQPSQQRHLIIELH